MRDHEWHHQERQELKARLAAAEEKARTPITDVPLAEDSDGRP